MILDIEKPDAARRSTRSSTPSGCINDLHDVKLGITYVSEFAYLADGKNGLRVVQLTRPRRPGTTASARGRRPGWSPRTRSRTAATALAISKGLDRDRAVDEAATRWRLRPRRRTAAATSTSSSGCTCETAGYGPSIR